MRLAGRMKQRKGSVPPHRNNISMKAEAAIGPRSAELTLLASRLLDKIGQPRGGERVHTPCRVAQGPWRPQRPRRTLQSSWFAE